MTSGGGCEHERVLVPLSTEWPSASSTQRQDLLQVHHIQPAAELETDPAETADLLEANAYLKCNARRVFCTRAANDNVVPQGIRPIKQIDEQSPANTATMLIGPHVHRCLCRPVVRG